MSRGIISWRPALIACFAFACGDSDGDGDDARTPDAAGTPAPVSYANDVAPIFAAKCNDCHHPGSATRLDLTQPFDMEIGLVNRMNTWVDSPLELLVEPG